MKWITRGLLRLAMLLMLVAGCGGTVWTHPTKGPTDFQRDAYECEQVATQAAANWRMAGNPLVIADEQMRCLQIRYGWTQQRVSQ